MYSHSDHTFAVCAYKESPYLEQCLDSLFGQSVKTNVIVATATPNGYIEKVCRKFDVPMHVRDGEPGIASDWNYAISCASTPLVTIAHQDDTYGSEYAKRMLNAVNSVGRPLLYFTNYGELREGERVDENAILRIKRVMLTPLKLSSMKNSRFLRRRILSLGTPICCPSVTFVTPHIPMPIFSEKMKCSLDWDAWERVSRLEGGYLYDSEILMHHRIHEDSETTAMIKDNTRTREDTEMFERFWPRPVARFLASSYQKSQKSNQ